MAVYFAARTLLQKFGVSMGIMTFASLTNFGNSVGDDLGIRLSGPAGCVCCLCAAACFSFYDEADVVEGDAVRGHGHEEKQAPPSSLPPHSVRVTLQGKAVQGGSGGGQGKPQGGQPAAPQWQLTERVRRLGARHASKVHPDPESRVGRRTPPPPPPSPPPPIGRPLEPLPAIPVGCLGSAAYGN